MELFKISKFYWFHLLILEKMKSCFWKFGVGFWTHGFIRLLDRRRKITYHPLLIGFFLKVISMQEARCNMLHLHVAQQLPSCSCTSELSSTNDKDAELNRQLPFEIDLSKILPDLLKLRMKVAWHTIFTTYVRSASSKLCS